MKVVIIEGMDNTGKTTVIHGLMQHYNNVYYMHATKPEEVDPIKCAIAQKKYFNRMIESIKNVIQSRCDIDLIILDRSWVGEYVYGCLYRGNGDYYVRDMIKECYEHLARIPMGIIGLNFSTILYTASPEFCSRMDDGNSISEGRIDAIKLEGERFEEIMKSDEVIGKKCIINVEKNGVFLTKEEILQMTMNVINAYEDQYDAKDLLYIQGEKYVAPDVIDETEDLDTNVDDNGEEDTNEEEEENR